MANGYTTGYNQFSYCDDPDDAIIDESFMPMELRGKKWKTERALGEGSYFKVYLVTNDDGLKYAMRWNRKEDRSIAENKENEERQMETALFMKNNLKNALQLNEVIGHHPNIVRLIGFRKVNLSTQRIMEYVNGGDLYDFIEQNYSRRNRQMGIRKVRSLFSDLLKAVKHIHGLCIAHMDIKVENCLITLNGNLKLTDFDEAIYFEPGKKMRCPVYATTAYAAPETFNREYRPDCADIWACGIVLYYLLKQNVPWEAAKKDDDSYCKWYEMQFKEYFFHFPRYGNASEFLLKMLKVDADERATVDEIITHQWLRYSEK
ncbi:Protein kinase domain family protein [Acanthocheilonema viteae]